MSRVFIRFVLTASCVLLIASAVDASETSEPAESHAAAQEIGRKYTEQFYQGQLAVLHARFSDEMKSTMDLEAFQKVRSQLDQQLGNEAEMYDERIEKKDEYLVYVRRARFEKYAGVIEVRWILNDENAIAGVFFTPERKTADQP